PSRRWASATWRSSPAARRAGCWAAAGTTADDGEAARGAPCVMAAQRAGPLLSATSKRPRGNGAGRGRERASGALLLAPVQRIEVLAEEAELGLAREIPEEEHLLGELASGEDRGRAEVGVHDVSLAGVPGGVPALQAAQVGDGVGASCRPARGDGPFPSDAQVVRIEGEVDAREGAVEVSPSQAVER